MYVLYEKKIKLWYIIVVCMLVLNYQDRNMILNGCLCVSSQSRQKWLIIVQSLSKEGRNYFWCVFCFSYFNTKVIPCIITEYLVPFCFPLRYIFYHIMMKSSLINSARPVWPILQTVFFTIVKPLEEWHRPVKKYLDVCDFDKTI